MTEGEWIGTFACVDMFGCVVTVGAFIGCTLCCTESVGCTEYDVIELTAAVTLVEAVAVVTLTTLLVALAVVAASVVMGCPAVGGGAEKTNEQCKISAIWLN